MATYTCEPNVWTTIPAVGGDMLLEARGKGVYVDTTGTTPANPTEGYALASNESMVIAEGLVVNVQPAQPIKAAVVSANPV